MEKKSIAVGLALGVLLTASFFLYQQNAPAQQIAQPPKPALTLEKFKAGGWIENSEVNFLIMDAGIEKRIWANNGIDPEFVFPPNGRPALARDIMDQASSGVQIGVGNPAELLLARSTGFPVKVIAVHISGTTNKIYVKVDSPVKTVKDLDGRKIGISQAGSVPERLVLYLNKKFDMKAESVPIGNITNQVVALKLGKVDAFVAFDAAPLRLVDSGELRILLRFADILPRPDAAGALYATEDLIEQNPDLVRRFAKAWLEAVRYVKDNPTYAADLYMKKTGAPKDLADKGVSQLVWTPDGRGGGLDMTTALRNRWQWSVDSGAVPSNVNVKIEDAVDVRFLP